MDGKQQKNRNKSTFSGRARGEASQEPLQGSEPSVAENDLNKQRSDKLMEEILEKENLKLALKAVLKNKGAPGVDGMTVEMLPGYLKEHYREIRTKLLEGKYTPQPVRRVEIPKAGGGVRKLGIPTAMDRWLQQAVQQVFQKSWDPTFSESSFGFRPKRSAHQAIDRAQSYIREGYSAVVDMDLEKFFDRVNHDVLMSRVARRVEDKRVLKLIRAYLNAGVMENGLFTASEEGVPQGGPLSPILSNLLLDELDRELEERNLKFVRYADDCNIYVKSARAGERVLKSITKFLETRLRLQVNKEKSAVGKPCLRKFLGFSFTCGRNPKRRIASTSIDKFKKKIRLLTKPTKGQSLTQVILEIRSYLIGWRGYFSHCETPSILQGLDKWIRRRLRSLVWRHWKRGRKRYAELLKRGVNSDLAAKTCGSPKRSWRLSKTLTMSVALPNSFFSAMGLPSLVRSI